MGSIDLSFERCTASSIFKKYFGTVNK